MIRGESCRATIRFSCAGCGRRGKALTQFAGQRGSCSGCGAAIQLPRAHCRAAPGSRFRLAGVALGVCMSLGLLVLFAA